MAEKVLALCGRGKGPVIPVRRPNSKLEVDGLLEGEEARLVGTNLMLKQNAEIELPASMTAVQVEYKGENPLFTCFVKD